MKKTILLASLIAVASMAAGTTGNVEFFNENKLETTPIKFTAEKLGVKTEVKVKDSGLSFGGEFKVKDLGVPLATAVHENLVNNSSIFVKYELPEIKTVNSYVKATVKPNTDNKKFALELEADANTKFNNLKIGVNTKTDLKVGELKDTTSTHKLYVEGEYAPVKDIKAEVAVNHTYADAKVNYVSTKFEGAYKEVKDLELKGSINAKVQINGSKLSYKSIMREDDADAETKVDIDPKVDGNRYVHSYEFDAKYTGVKDLELNGKLFVQHLHNPGKTPKQDNAISYGTILGVKYTGVKNLTLSGKGVFAGYTDMKDQTVHTDSTHQAYIKLNAGAKYDYKVTDKFTVSPEFNATAVLDNLKGTEANGVVKGKTIDLVLEPKVSVEYKPTESLEIKGNVAVPVKFSIKAAPFNYETTTLKTSLNVKYTW